MFDLQEKCNRMRNAVMKRQFSKKTDILTNEVTRLRLVATPLGGCADNAVQEITVTTQALPSVEAGDNGAICYIPGSAIAPFTILGTAVDNASSTSWTTSGAFSGNFSLGTPVVYESFSNNCTPELLTLTANGVGACSTETRSDTVTLTINCTIQNLGTITGLDTICQGNSGVVYTVPVNSSVITYDWQVPTGSTIVSGQGTNSITVDYGSTAVSGNVSVNFSFLYKSPATTSLRNINQRFSISDSTVSLGPVPYDCTVCVLGVITCFIIPFISFLCSFLN